jgi:hypothetical protein
LFSILFFLEPDEVSTLQIDGFVSPLGILAYKVPNLKKGNEVFDTIHINLPLYDVRDGSSFTNG